MHWRHSHRLGLLFIGIVGCRAARIDHDRSSAWTTLHESQARWYPIAWGTPMGPATVDTERRRFECIWDALTREGRDPRVDVACVARQIDAVVACSHGEPRAEVCLERSRAVCSLSSEYQRAALTCRAVTPS